MPVALPQRLGAAKAASKLDATRSAAKRLRVLLVEDSKLDAELVLRVLKRGGYRIEIERVTTAEGLKAALNCQAWDVVISDYRMPAFSAPEALAIVRERDPDLPFIVVSGTIGEDVAVETMKAGADDYVMKDNLTRLLPAVERELREAEARRGRKVAEQALRQSEAKYRGLIEQASDGIFVSDENANFVLANTQFCRMLGYTQGELLALNVADTYPEGERDVLARRLAHIRQSKSGLFERAIRRKDGSCFPVEISVRHIGNGNYHGIVRDITARKKTQLALAESEERFRQLAENVHDVFFLVDVPTGRTLYVNPAFDEIWGQSRENLYVDRLFWTKSLHPEDRERILAGLQRSHAEGFDKTFRIVRPDGSVRWIHARGVPVRDASGKVFRIAGISEDVTESRVQQDKITHLTRIYAVLSGIDSAIVRVSSRDELFREACRIVVEDGRFKLGWIGVVDAQNQRVSPVAWHGIGENYIELMPLGLNEERALPARAIRERRPMIANDIRINPFPGLREEALRRGFLSAAVLPLLISENPVGVLVLCAGETGFFSEEEIKLLVELAGDISFALDRFEKEEKLNYLAYYDSLTGLANQTLFRERLEQHVHAAAHERRKLALILFDIERFKTINDTFGRQAGDRLLKQFGERIVQHATDVDRIGRLSADRFAIAVPDLKDADVVARRLEQKFREWFGQPFQVNGTELRISAKVGVAVYPEDGPEADALFRNAEAALKKAKETGQRYLFYTPQMTERVAEKLDLENRLRQALEKEQFVLHYQPKIDADSRRIAGVEALIRWMSPELGLVAPMKFIPLMEETGLIIEVGAWALRRAVLDHRYWVELGLAAPRIAVNVSPIQLRMQNFVAGIEVALKEGASPAGIDLEVTESVIMEDVQANSAKLRAVRELGSSIAIDDFGTGYSSLGYLAKLPVEALKIDRSFIITMTSDPDIMTLVTTIITLAHSLRLKVVAEGVDSEEQAKYLRLLRCDQVQGYLFSKPLPREEMTALLKRA